jgi:site-specific DNA recombinase
MPESQASVQPWAIYARISRVRRTDGQVETLGVERQEPPCRELVERRGGQVYRVFVDNDISAYSGKRRPAYEAMLADAKAGRLRGIAAWHADRLARQPIENEGLIVLAERYGVQLATVTGEHDLSTPSGRLHFRMLGNIARYESEHRAERLRLKGDEMARDGKPKGGGERAFGFERDGLTLREDEAALLREATTRILDLGETTGQVVKDWRRRGVFTTAGKPFTTTGLRRCLVRPRTAGLRQHRGEVVGEATWPAIITPEQRNRLVAFYGRPDRKRQGPPRTYLLSGLLRCGRPGCGAPMIAFGKDRNGKALYSCRRDTDHHRGCGRTFITAEHVEPVMIEAFKIHVCGPGFAEAVSRRVQAAAEDDPSPARLEADRRELAELARLKGEGRFTIPEWLALRDPIEARIRQAEARLEARPDLRPLLDIPRSREELDAAWARWTPQERRRYFEAVVDHIVVGPATRRRFFDPDRLTPRWRV